MLKGEVSSHHFHFTFAVHIQQGLWRRHGGLLVLSVCVCVSVSLFFSLPWKKTRIAYSVGGCVRVDTLLITWS